MIRLILPSILLVATHSASAQEPKVTVELVDPEVIVGQPGALTITILVPTWMPKAPVFPSFEVPSLMVRLPEGATTSISERIEGETWAGLRRTYRLYPLAEGTFVFPAQSIGLTYADPETREPKTFDAPTPQIQLTATVPEAARGLSPLIIATSFELEQTIDGEETLVAGDAIVRQVRAAIGGTTPLLIPELIPSFEGEVLRAYPSEPTVEDTEDRALLSGTRTEKTTYVAQVAGDASLPEISLDWFNLVTGRVETVSLPGKQLEVEGGRSASAERSLSARTLLFLTAFACVVGLLAYTLRPRVLGFLHALHDRWHASERFAHRQVMKAIAAKDLGKIYTALEIWQVRCHVTIVEAAPVFESLLTVGRKRYGNGSGEADWATIKKTYLRTRRSALRNQKSRNSQSLPQLNPKLGN